MSLYASLAFFALFFCCARVGTRDFFTLFFPKALSLFSMRCLTDFFVPRFRLGGALVDAFDFTEELLLAELLLFDLNPLKLLLEPLVFLLFALLCIDPSEPAEFVI
jgi:hypothetical protein